ncbi:Slp family lipoprotein [Geoalkalibacter halelectricus]|nr:Slp family lipoprotein [Geoalkalibacter halelectricus]MDO3378133.1 Slp family lipoprotein [Geoalkalibacter halelectricus]
MKSVLSLLVALLLLGASRPISLPLYQQIDHGLTLAQIQQHPELYVGRLVLVGGKIHAVRFREDTGHDLRIMPYLLHGMDRPVVPEPNGRAFHARLETAAIHELLTPGRLVTLAGEVLGVIEPASPEGPEVLLAVREIHPWLTREELRSRQRPYYPYWRDPWCPYPGSLGYPYPYPCW